MPELPLLGKLPADWSVSELRSLLKEGTRNGIYKSSEFHGTGDKIVNMGELFAYPRLFDIPMKRVSLSADERARFLLQERDLLFARRSLVAAGAGKCSVVCEMREPTSFESSIIRARPDGGKADSLYLFYLFQSPFGLYALNTIRRDMAVSGITGKDLERLLIPVPPLPEQHSIGQTLGELDSKIELNRQTNETLEGIARAIFKSWFVDFDPVRAKMEGRWHRGESLPGLPAVIYDLFPNAFVDSALGKIPKGWRAAKMGEIGENARYGLQPDDIPAGTPYIGLEHIARKSIALVERGISDGLESGKFEFGVGDILFGKLRPYFHKVAVAVEDGVCSTDILGIRAVSHEWRAFLTFLLSSAEVVDYASAVADGTRMPRAAWRDLANYAVALPSSAVAKVFNEYALPMIESIRCAIHESRILAAIRDALLPKLVSGEIHIKNAEKAVETEAESLAISK